jgi:hypothetical protein
MPLPDFTHPIWFFAATLVVFAVVVGRYFLIAGLFHAIFFLWFPERWQQRKISQKGYKPAQFRREVKWSLLTASIFAVAGSADAGAVAERLYKSVSRCAGLPLVVVAGKPWHCHASARNLLLLAAPLDAPAKDFPHCT